jgi:spore coat polysaccharide biosynthesis protein SpsF (cytidylyltransferase family)
MVVTLSTMIRLTADNPLLSAGVANDHIEAAASLLQRLSFF